MLNVMKRYQSRKYWENYINCIIESINDDKETIIDLLNYGNLEKAEIIMNLCVDCAPSYIINVKKMSEKSPFGDEDDE